MQGRTFTPSWVIETPTFRICRTMSFFTSPHNWTMHPIYIIVRGSVCIALPLPTKQYVLWWAPCEAGAHPCGRASVAQLVTIVIVLSHLHSFHFPHVAATRGMEMIADAQWCQPGWLFWCVMMMHTFNLHCVRCYKNLHLRTSFTSSNDNYKSGLFVFEVPYTSRRFLG